MDFPHLSEKYKKWVNKFHTSIEKDIPDWICCSCHKEDYEKKLIDIETKKVKGVMNMFPEIFYDVVTKHKIISPKGISSLDILPNDDVWKVIKGLFIS